MPSLLFESIKITRSKLLVEIKNLFSNFLAIKSFEHFISELDLVLETSKEFKTKIFGFYGDSVTYTKINYGPCPTTEVLKYVLPHIEFYKHNSDSTIQSTLSSHNYLFSTEYNTIFGLDSGTEPQTELIVPSDYTEKSTIDEEMQTNSDFSWDSFESNTDNFYFYDSLTEFNVTERVLEKSLVIVDPYNSTRIVVHKSDPVNVINADQIQRLIDKIEIYIGNFEL